MKTEIKLQELAEKIIRGKPISPSQKNESGAYRVIGPKNFTGGDLKLLDNDYYINPTNFEPCIIEKGDILISLIGPNFHSVVISNIPAEPLTINNYVAVIKSKNNHYLNTFFNSNTGKKHFIEIARRFSSGVTIPKLSILNLKNLTIPFFPLKDLNEFVKFKPESGSIYETQIADSLVLKLESIGWEVKREFRIQVGSKSFILDLALFKKGVFETFVEIKRRSRNEFVHNVKRLKEQLNQYLSKTRSTYCFCFFNGQLFKYDSESFSPLNDFPYPENKTKHSTSIDFEFFKEVLDENLRLKEELRKNNSIQEQLTQISNEIFIIKSTTLRTEEKVDSIINLITSLDNEFKETKNTTLDLHEKILKLNRQLDSSISEILDNHKVSIASYREILEQWFSFEWDKFEDLSRSYLPSAEYLFDNLKKLENPDLSPFILQYCRALENEMLNKIFRNYVKSIQNRSIDFDNQFSWDIQLKENKKPKSESSYKFARHIQKCLRTDESKWFFELGTMRIYLEYLTGNTINKSPLLQDFKSYLLTFFDSNILDAEFLIKIKETTEEYRNKAAHPNKISFEDATLGKVKIKKLLKKFLEMYEYAT